MTEDSKCLVCGARRVYSLADAIAHAPCDQRLAAVDPDREEGVPLFWDACGAASSAHRNADRNGG